MTLKKESVVALRGIQGVILDIRGQKVILDNDLAVLYGVTTKALNQAVRRNAERFPDDFAFQLTPQEVARLRSQIVTSNTQKVDNQHVDMNRSQIVTGSGRGGLRYRPFAFTEHGALMAANVLRSPKAVEMSVFIVRAFVQMRGVLVSQYEMAGRVDQIEKILLVHDVQLKELFDKIRPLLLPPPEPPAKSIGFSVKESRGKYQVRKDKGKK